MVAIEGEPHRPVHDESHRRLEAPDRPGRPVRPRCAVGFGCGRRIEQTWHPRRVGNRESRLHAGWA